MIVVHFNFGLFFVFENFLETVWWTFKAVKRLILMKPIF